ncbi:hypothetical protein F2Q68_00003768 [Brassica cretica]|uniref:DUF1985 domain-containing protein n=1 Tax=Brassica cretica TaxID=69181 RepID=A0A8S9J5G3_BRACR|nr:hypothetical protein F2Q68_00003768 [Brassica cretica]
MEMPELPRRIYTLGEEPPAVHSISYHTCWTLHAALKKALHDDEYEELKESKLGVFIKFQELGFDWASRLVHYMLGFQLAIKKKYELWSLVGPQPVRFSLLEFENLTGLNCEYIEDLERPHCIVTKELTSFWGMLGVHVEAGPSTQEIIAAFERCKGWSRDDRKRLSYLAIFTGYIEGRKYFGLLHSQALQVWVYTALPESGATYGNPLPNNPPPPILAYKGRRGRMQFKEAILSQTRVINFFQKDIGEMFPKWEFDVEDRPAENIIKLMFVKKPWKWTMDCWEVTGTWVNTKPAVVSPAKKKVVKEDNPRPRKKARKEAPAETSEEAAAEASEEAVAEASEEVTMIVGGLTKEDIKTMFKDIADAMREGFGTCLKEIKYLSERVEAVEKKVGITTKRKGTSSQNTTSPPKPTLEPGTRVINFVQKDIGEMFLKWEFDVEDTPAENIIKLMFVKKPWKWTMDCWEVTGTWVNTKLAVVSPTKKMVVKEDSPRPRKKPRKEASEEAAAVASEEAAAEASEEVHTTVSGLTKEDIKTMFKDIVDAMREGFGTCLKEIKYLSERVEAVEKKSESVNGTNAGRKSLPEDKGPDKEDARYLEKRDATLALCRAKSDRTRKLAASQQSPYTANSTAKVIIPNKKLYPGYNLFASIDKKKLKELADWLKTCPHYRTPLDKKPRTSRTWWYQILRTSLEWLEDCKDIGEIFPKWEVDDEDTPAENIIKLMFVKKPWSTGKSPVLGSIQIRRL